MKVVLSVGGSLLNPGKPDADYIEKLARLVIRLSRRYQFAIICGGGKPARDFAEAVRKFGGNEFLADEAAILLTRANAFLMVAALGEHAFPTPLYDFTKAAEACAMGKVVVMGGTIPGFTTDADAALLSEKIGARRLVNLSNIDSIYSEDPKINPRAKKYRTLSHRKLVELANKFDLRMAGQNFVFDNIACKIIARSNIETHFVHGWNLRQVEAAIKGKPHKGTVVRD